MRRCLLVLTAVCFLFLASRGQAGSLDYTFNPETGANNFVYTTAIQTDGRIIIGGDFTAYNGTAINCVARLNTSGLLDTTFKPGTGVNGFIQACAIQGNGQIVIGGSFSSFNGTAVNSIARLNTDGSLDTNFTTGSGFNSYVSGIAVQSNQQIIVVGNFTSYNNVSRKYVLRLNTDGSLDNSFNPGSAFDNTVEAVAIQTNGQIILGGSFQYSPGFPVIPKNKLIRVNTDGSIDNNFNVGLGPSSTVYALAIQSDGYIVIGGAFTAYNGNSVNRIGRVDTEGNLDGTFNTGQGVAAQVQCIAIQNDGLILVGGAFIAYDGTSINHIFRIESGGAIDPSFYPGTAANAQVNSFSIQNDGRVILGGDFTAYNDTARNYIARIYNCNLSAPDVINGSSTTVCPGSIQQYSVPPVAGADYYTWSLPAGWSGNSDSAVIIATSNGTGGVISVIANSDTCGASPAQTLTVTQIQAPAVPVCLVTVDSQSAYNIVIWDKPVTAMIDSFFVYREVATNVYAKIGAVPFDSLSEYDDYGANPNATSYSYKLSVLDTCGVESALSDYHSTIHLQNLANGNLQWTLYTIENTPNPVIQYNVYRDDSSTGNFVLLDTVPGNNNTFTDVNHSSFPDCSYVLDVKWGISCSPTRAVSTTRSNIKRQSSITPIDTVTFPYPYLPPPVSPWIPLVTDVTSAGTENDLEIYPNPAYKTVTARFAVPVKLNRLQIWNSLGQIVYREPAERLLIPFSTKQINVETLAAGVYTVHAEMEGGKIIKRLVIL